MSIPYTWEQTLEDVTVIVKVPTGTTSKMVSCKIEKEHLLIGLKGETPIVDGDLSEPVIPGESMWNIQDAKEGREIMVNLVKKQGMHWWKNVIKGDPEIDTTKIQPENSRLQDLDPDTRRTVEEMMYNQRAKQLGQPTTDEIKNMETLKMLQEKNPDLFNQLQNAQMGKE